jgi:hypothetical protein
VIDGSIDTGWESPDGQTTNQVITVGFGNTSGPVAVANRAVSSSPAADTVYRFTDIFIDPAATHGDTSDADLKDFAIRASTDGTHFTTVLTGTTLKQNTLQQFHLSPPVDASELQIVALDNYGSASHVAISEFEAYSKGPAPQIHAFAHLLRADAKQASSKKTSSTKLPPNIALVRAIHRGLTVTPPHKRGQQGKKKMKLFSQYGLGTGAGQKASIGFVEGTVLQMNQLTELVLTSPHVTTVQRGEVQQFVKPGSNHRVQTAVAIASAVGTIFDVRVFKHKKTIFTVVEGALVVKNGHGSTLVKTDEQAVVNAGQAPSPPQPANIQALTWTSTLSSPNLGQNLALDSNGGHVISAP